MTFSFLQSHAWSSWLTGGITATVVSEDFSARLSKTWPIEYPEKGKLLESSKLILRILSLSFPHGSLVASVIFQLIAFFQVFLDAPDPLLQLPDRLSSSHTCSICRHLGMCWAPHTPSHFLEPHKGNCSLRFSLESA